MTRHPRLFAALAVLTLAAGPALAADDKPAAAEKTVPAASQEALSLTVYNDDLALVRERRTVVLDKGANTLAFEGVAAKLLAETALLRPVGEGGAVTVAEQGLDFDLITPARLLAASVGGEVSVIHTNPATGAETREPAKVLAAGDGVVLQFADRIETGVPGRLAFDKLPPGLRAKPTLVARVEAAQGGSRGLELGYLATGLGWHADYVANLAPGGDKLALMAWATITNTSGAGFADARLTLAAGTVHRAAATPSGIRTRAIGLAAPAPPPPVAEEALAGMHLYAIPRPVSLADNQTRQLALMSADAVPVRREYVSPTTGYNNGPNRVGELPEAHAALFLLLDNAEKTGLGTALPAGVVRVYQPDSGGALRFVGEDRLRHTAVGETIRLQLGEEFDLTVTRVQTASQRMANDLWETAWDVRVRNAKKEAVTVHVEDAFPGDWTITEESQPHANKDSRTASWPVAVPAGGETVLHYRARIKG